MWNSRNDESDLEWHKVNQLLPTARDVGSGLTGAPGNLFGDGNDLHLDCGSGHVGMYICQNWSNTFLCVYYL